MYNPINNKIIYEPISLFDASNSDQNLFHMLNFKGKSGYFMKKLYTESPYYKAGVRSGDILIKFNNYDVDNHGECFVPWSDEKVHVKDLISRFTTKDTVPIEYWSFENNTTGNYQKTVINFEYGTPYKIRKLYPPFDKIDYEIIGGMVVMELNLNHIINLDENDEIPRKLKNKLKIYTDTDKRFNSELLITSILQGSYVYSLDNVAPGELIDKVNGKIVRTLNDLRSALTNPILINSKLYTIVLTRENTIIVLDNEKEIIEKQFLCKSHKIIKY
jgi:hypothetical protein